MNCFAVYNSYNETEMGYIIDDEKIAMPISSNQIVAHPSATVVLLTENRFKSKESSQVFPVDYLIVAFDNSFSITELAALFQPKKIIIDASIGRYTAEKMRKECDKLNVPYHDISNSGAFLVKF